MFDDEAGRAFSAFVLALLPRLLLYPGGLFALVVAGVFPFLLHSRHSAVSAVPLPPPSATSAIFATALAWAGLALLPLPGLTALPGGPDLLAPLGLLLAASLLLIPLPPNPDRRVAGGYGLLLLSPLLTLAQSPTGSLLLLPAPTTLLGGALRGLTLLAFASGFAVVYAAPMPRDFISTLAIHIPQIGWLGLGAVMSIWPLPVDSPLIGPLLLGGPALIVGRLCALPAVQRYAGRLVTVGWAALGLALVGVLGQGL